MRIISIMFVAIYVYTMFVVWKNGAVDSVSQFADRNSCMTKAVVYRAEVVGDCKEVVERFKDDYGSPLEYKNMLSSCDKIKVSCEMDRLWTPGQRK